MPHEAESKIDLLPLTMTVQSSLSNRKWWIESPDVLEEGDKSFLCDVCRHINFQFLLFKVPLLQIPEINEVPLGPYSKVLEKQSCAFCRLVKITLDNYFIDVPLPTEHEGKPVMLSMISTSETFIQLKPRQLLLWVKPNPLDDGKTPSLEIQVVQEDRSTSLDASGLGRHINLKELDFLLALYWVRTCRIGHGLHRNTDMIEGGTLPPNFRLIDVERMCVVAADSSMEYVTLSYVWPKKDQLKLEKGNKDDIIGKDKSLEELRFNSKIPQTIKDVMGLCARIADRYLWVDALCIVQDDRDDRIAQIRAMNTIYGSSILTIAATCGEGAEASLPGVQFDSRTILQEPETIQGLRLTNRPWSFDKAVQRSRWNTRAWTFQERILSKRILFVTPQQMFFRCCHSPSYMLEDLDTSPQPRRRVTYPMDDTGTDEIPHRWSINTLTYQKTVENFTARQITKPCDILNAFKGIEAKMTSIFRSGFLHGLPQSELDYCLMWEPCGKLERRICTNNECPNPRFPSWSWAGWIGAVEYKWLERLSRVRWVDASDQKFTSDEYRAPSSKNSKLDVSEWRREWTEERTDWGFRFFHHSSDPDVWFRNPTAPESCRGPNCDPSNKQHLRFEAQTVEITMPKEWSAQSTGNAAGAIWEFSLRNDDGREMGFFRVPTNLAREMSYEKSYSFVRIARVKHSLSPEDIRARKDGRVESGADVGRIADDTPLEDFDGDEDVLGEPASYPEEVSSQDAKNYLPFDRQRYDAYKLFCLYEFLVVERVGDVAYRIGKGQIHVDAWAQDSPKTEIIVMG
jgi:hypothetical protein